MGIYRVQLASLDTTTNGVADGYRDYSCGTGPTLLRGATYTLLVRTNPSADETVRAWIDFDDNGQFSSAELILSSNAARQHQASFAVPATAATGRSLRLRIAADYVNSPIPTACSTSQYSQTEDYRVRVSASAPPRPVVRFVALDTVSCGAAVIFRDQSLNSPATWQWSFGDNTSSAQQSPTHTYALPGTYAVRLRACNAAGCDSLTKASYITVRSDAPRPAPCAPATATYCCGFGLTRIRLATLDHASADGSTGYQDFSCAHRTTLTADRPVPLQLTTGPNAHDVRVYLDLNDNGQFDLPGELLYEGLGVQSPATTVQVAATALGLVYNRPLRLRVWTDIAGTTPFGPCVSPQRGQVEDYSVLVLPNAGVPAAQFSLSYPQWCGPTRVAVANTTTGGATSYAWDFGDGTTSTAVTPPIHT
ncbi:MAG: PKD domain-containing protein, partial [Hymenobacter sp.]|nr:PKD domain-containing protein [Hymenobacter sp.]